MLDSIRSFAGNFTAKLLMALLVLSFAVWGVGDMIGSAGRNQAIATVGGKPIAFADFQRELRAETEKVQRMLGGNYSPEIMSSLRLPEQVLRRMVGLELLRLETEAIGIVPGDADLVRHIRANPAFQGASGSFDKALFAAHLRNLGVTEKDYVEQLRAELASGLALDTLTSIEPASDIAVRTLFTALKEQRAATLYQLSPSAVAVKQPAPEEIGSYYDAHKQEFSTPEIRKLSYVMLKAQDAYKDISVSEEELQAAYAERLGEFRRPERRAVEQLLYASREKAEEAHRLLSQGKSLREVADATEILNKGALSLGTVERERIPGDAADEVFSLEEGGFTQPVQSAFGWHIFRVGAIEPPSTAPLSEVRAMLEKDLRQRKGDEKLSEMANALEDALAGGGTLAEAAKELGLAVHSLPPVTREGKTLSGGAAEIPELDRFLEVAFDTGEQAESPLTTSRGGVYYIVRVDELTPERARPLDAVRPQVVAGWQKQERARLLAQRSQEIAKAFADPKARSETIARHRLTSAPSGVLKRTAQSASLPAGLVADIFSRRPGESTAAYPAAGGGYVLAVVERIIPRQEPAPDSAALREVEKNLNAAMQNEIVEQYMAYLADKYPVTVHERLLESVMRQGRE